MTRELRDGVGVFCVIACAVALAGCQDRKITRQIIIPFEEISPGGLTRIENTCRELKTVLSGSQDTKICLEVAASSVIMTQLCARIDAGWSDCLPLVRLGGGKATLETPEATFVVTQLQSLYP